MKYYNPLQLANIGSQHLYLGAMKEKTAMQELIENFKQIQESQDPFSVQEAIEFAQSMLEKEKEQMKRAFMEGALSWATGSGADDYYNETYGEQ